MKKVFSLSIILAVLTAALTFSSCGGDEEAAVIKVTFNQGGNFDSGETVVATIESKDEKLTSIELWKGGSKLKNLTIPSEKDGVYVLSIVDLEDGDYLLKVASKTGAKEASFKVGKAVVVVPSFEAKLGGPSASAGSFLSIKDGKVYTSSATSAQLKNVEIVFDGNTFISATSSINSTVNTNGLSADIDEIAPGVFSYDTSTGFEGTITITNKTGSGTATVVDVTVTKSKK